MLRRMIHWITENSPNTCYIRCVNVRGGGVESQERGKSRGRWPVEKARGEGAEGAGTSRQGGPGEGRGDDFRGQEQAGRRRRESDLRSASGEDRPREAADGETGSEADDFGLGDRSKGYDSAEGSGRREAGGEGAAGAVGQDPRARSAREVRIGNVGAAALPRGRAARRVTDGPPRVLRPARLVLRARTPLPRGGRCPQAGKAPSGVHGLTR